MATIVLRGSGTPLTFVQLDANFSNLNAAIIALENKQSIIGTPIATTADTFKEFAIPAWAKQITISFDNVTKGVASALNFLLGTSAGIETTGYNAFINAFGLSMTTINTTATDSFPSVSTGVGATNDGSITLTLANATTNKWVVSGQFRTAQYAVFVNGSKSLAGVLDKLRITTGGAGNFTAGSVNVYIE